MKVSRLAIEDVLLIEPVKHGDDRGFFSETFRRDVLSRHGVDCDFVQDNHSFSAQKGTLRGLHFQIAPHEQAKLVRVVRGEILDVAVDLRVGSPTYGKHVAVTLSASNWAQLYVPVGFAHGFVTTTEDTEVVYKTSGYYAPECDRGVAFDDPALAIAWPVGRESAQLSAKDRALPRLDALAPAFHFEKGAMR